MKTYKVWVRETIEYQVEVEATDTEDALKAAEDEVSMWPARADELKHLEIEALSAEEVKEE